MKFTMVILYCKNMDKMVRFYRDIFGFSVSYPKDKDSYEGESWVEFDTTPCKLALHHGGNQDIGKDAPELVFEVENLAATREAFLKKGIPLTEIKEISPNELEAKGTDPEGNHFVLVQFKK